MTDRPGREQKRIAARGGAIAAGYLLYLGLDRAHSTLASALVGGGLILVALAGIDMWARPAGERPAHLLWALGLGGTAASAVGLALVFA